MRRSTLLAALAAAACQSGSVGGRPGGPSGGPVAVEVRPVTARLSPGQAQAFSATVTGTADLAVRWTVRPAGSGTVDASGNYTAPATPGSYQVVATSAADATASAAALVTVAAPTAPGTYVTGYWADWVAGNMLRYPHTAVDWTALTHLTVAFSYPDAGGDLAYHGGNLDSALARQVTAAAHTNGRQALLMIGGAGSAADLAAATGDTADSARAFAQKIVAFAQADGFDGVDLDWEGIYAGANGAPGDEVRLRNLATALRTLWPGLVLTVALGWDQAGQSFWSGMKDAGGQWLFDQHNVMTYDAANSWDGWEVWFHNAFADDASARPSSAVRSLSRLAAQGVPRERIGMGIPFYGSAWTLAAGSGAYYPRQTLPAGKQTGNGATQGADSVWTYKFILDNYLRPYDGPDPVVDAAGRTRPDGVHAGYLFDVAAGTPYVTGGTAGWTGIAGTAPAITFLSFEDPSSIAGRGAWVRQNRYGGCIIWLINQGATDAAGTNPLLSAVKQAFLE